jgi:hypothetical protein
VQDPGFKPQHCKSRLKERRRKIRKEMAKCKDMYIWLKYIKK